MSEMQNNPEEVTPEIIDKSDVNDELSPKVKEQAEKIADIALNWLSSLTQKSDTVIQGEKMSAVLTEQISNGTLTPDERLHTIDKSSEIIDNNTKEIISQRVERIVTVLAATVVLTVAIIAESKK